MASQDSIHRYGQVTRLLHWGMAALISWQLLGMVVKIVFGRVPWVGAWVGTHASVGALIFVLALIRVIWAIKQRGNRPPYEPGVVGKLAAAGHFALYSLMLIISGLGLLRLFGGERPASLFGIPIHSGNAPEVAWMVAPANAVHGILGWVFLALILGHIAMVMVHQYMWRDDTLSRMRRG